jgi:hypothetical protein
MVCPLGAAQSRLSDLWSGHSLPDGLLCYIHIIYGSIGGAYCIINYYLVGDILLEAESCTIPYVMQWNILFYVVCANAHIPASYSRPVETFCLSIDFA